MRNKIIQTFDIHLLNINKDVETIDYQLDDSFFKSFEQDVVQKGNLKVIAEVVKTHAMITINLEISGDVKLVCDRSLEEFKYSLDIKDSLYYKYGDEDLDLDINLYQIKEKTNKLNIADDLLEFIMIEIPFRKIHPKFDEEEEDETDGPYYQTSVEDTEIEEEKVVADPRWAELKKLKK